MISEYIKIAIRNLRKQRSSSLINIIGLSIGLASALLIFMFVFNELSYDRFYTNSKNIYKVYQHSIVDGTESRDAWTPVPMAAALLTDYPEIQNVVRILQGDNILITVDNKYFNIKNALYADSSFFEVFSFDPTVSESYRLLSRPHSVVLTKSTAQKIFGNEDPVDKLIRFENSPDYYRVAGVSKDPPANSHFEYEMLISMDSFWNIKSTDWMSNYMNTYVLLPSGSSPQNLEKKFPEMVKNYFGPQLQKVLGFSIEEFMSKGNYLEYKLQPITDIHLNTSVNHGLKPSGNSKYVYIFSVIGIFIICIAGINFINLSTSRSTLRAHDTIMRVILGSTRKIIRFQFLSESIIISIISMLLAILLIVALLPWFNKMTGLSLSLAIFDPWTLALTLSGFAVFIGFLAGLYPAFQISSFNTSSIKEKQRSIGTGSILRSILVIFQFSVAIVILSSTIIVYRQLKFMQNKELGFDRKELMVIWRANALSNHMDAFVEQIKAIPGIKKITSATSIPGFPNSDNGYAVEGTSQEGIKVLYTTWADYSYIDTYNMKLVAGRDFSKEFTSDSSAIIINEAAVKEMGLKEPVGTRLMRPDGTGKYDYHPVIGIVRDFHFKSLHSKIEPFALLIKPKNIGWNGFLTIRFNEGNKIQSIKKIEETWKKFVDNQPFEYTFLDDDLKSFYTEEKQTGSLAMIFTFLTIFIACLGLFGLISFTTARRTKEICIRKIMGASVLNIIGLLSNKTVKLLIISSLVAWPVAWIFLKNWLMDFPFRIELNPVILILTSIIILCLSLCTIGFRVWYAATRNPVDALRVE